jgi:flagellar secretion chaperone FliS
VRTAQRYQSVQITTSSPGELLVSLFDGLFRFLHAARAALAAGKRGPAGEAISRAHAILTELRVSLDPAHAPELCQNLSALYDFSLGKLTQANLRRDAAQIDQVIRVLGPVREAFTTVVRGGAAK